MGNTGASDAVAEKIKAASPELALGDVYDEAVFLQPLEKKMKMLFVGLSVFAGHQDVINIDKGELQTPTDSAHQALKGLGCIFQAKWHVKEFKESERSDDGSFRNVLCGHWNLVVASNEIDIRKYGHASEMG